MFCLKQEIKEEESPSFVFKPPSVQQIRDEDWNAVEFAQINKLDRDLVIENLGNQPIIELKCWSEFITNPILFENLRRSNYLHVRKVQQKVIPLILQGHNLKVQAETGAGKSCSFLVPIIYTILNQASENIYFNLETKPEPSCNFNRPKAIIIEPSRERTIQLYKQCLKLTKGTNVKVAVCFGQYDYAENAKSIWGQCDILIGTVGRLKHLCVEGIVNNRDLKFLVLDEADQLILDKAFDDIEAIINLNNFPTEVQTLMFSATYPRSGIKNYVDQLLTPTYLYVHTEKEVSVNNRIMQDFISVAKCDKPEQLYKTLLGELQVKSTQEIPRVMIFVNSKHDAQILKEFLTYCKFNALMLAGNLTSELRLETIKSYQRNNPPVIVTTDLCSRGIDIKNLDLVINYSLPRNLATYVNRIGRTGRLKFGRAISLIDLDSIEDRMMFDDLVAMLMNEILMAPQWMLEAAVNVRFINNRWISGFGDLEDEAVEIKPDNVFGSALLKYVHTDYLEESDAD